MTGVAMLSRIVNSFVDAVFPRKCLSCGSLFTKKTDEKQHLPPLDVPKKSIASLHLGLELKGTMVSDASEPLAVIFKIKEKREILVKEGDAIDSAVVHKIMKEKVLLQVKDQWAILLLKNKKTAPAEMALR